MYLSGDPFKVRQFEHDLQVGTETTTWPNGQKCVDAYANGKRSGTSRCWHPGGRKLSESKWEDGKMVSSKEWR